MKRRHIVTVVIVAASVVVAGVVFAGQDRLPDTNGWGYAALKHDPASDTWKARGKDASFAKSCHQCRVSGAKDRDFVYTNFANR